MSTTSHILELDEIQNLESGSLVELNGKIAIFLGKDGIGESRVAHYSFLFNDGVVKKFKGTMMLQFNGIKRIET